MPRAPAAELLVHLGVPEDFVRLWQDFLSKAQRCAEFQGGLGSPFTTGVAEGYPLSVVGWPLRWLCQRAATSGHMSITSAGWPLTCQAARAETMFDFVTTVLSNFKFAN